MKNLPVIGRVQNCSARDCDFNENGACRAPNGIEVMFHSDHADCLTYTKTRHRT